MEQQPVVEHLPSRQEDYPVSEESLLEEVIDQAAATEARQKTEGHRQPVRTYFLIQNIFVTIAALLFFLSMLPDAVIGGARVTVRAIAYLMGAVAYFSELAALTHGFRKKIPLHEMYMPYVFGFLYVLLCVNYLFSH